MREITTTNELTLHLTNPLPIRTTPDGKWMSVFDLLKGLTGDSNPRRLWEEGCTDCVQLLGSNLESYQFPGQGQKPTPVINREGFTKLFRFLLASGRLPQEQTAKLWDLLSERVLQPSLPSPAPVAALPSPEQVANTQAEQLISELAKAGYQPAQQFLKGPDWAIPDELRKAVDLIIPKLRDLAPLSFQAREFLAKRGHYKGSVVHEERANVLQFAAWYQERFQPAADWMGDAKKLYNDYLRFCKEECFNILPFTDFRAGLLSHWRIVEQPKKKDFLFQLPQIQLPKGGDQ